MDIVSLLEFVDKMPPGTIVHAEVSKDSTGDLECEVETVNGQKLEQA